MTLGTSAISNGRTQGLNLEPALRVLDAVILEPALWTKVKSLTSEDFFDDAHRDLFKGMHTLAARDLEICLPNLMDVVDREKFLRFDKAQSELHPRTNPGELDVWLEKTKRETRVRLLTRELSRIYGEASNGGIIESDLVLLADLARKVQQASGPTSFRELFDSHDELVNAPPLSFSIRDFLQNDGITMIGGPSGHGKTLIALSMARALLTGNPLWNHFPVEEKAVRVIYLIPECARGPFAHRLKLFDLLKLTAPDDERLLVRTLSKGRAPKLDDPRILFAAKGAHVFLDTAIRFSESRDENDASENQAFADALFALLASGARTVVGIHHSPKYFAKDTVMTLENVLRGSGDMGAILATCFGVKQIDKDQNIIHVENCKPRDFTPPLPFQLIGRPNIDDTGDFAMLKKPGECGSLEDEQPSANGSNDKKRDERLRRVAMVKAWRTEEPGLSNAELMAKFKAAGGIVVDERSVQRYRRQADRETSDDS